MQEGRGKSTYTHDEFLWRLKPNLQGGRKPGTVSRERGVKQESLEKMQRDIVGKRRYCLFQEQNDVHYVSYKRFRRRITQKRGSCEGPAVSTPLTTGGKCEPSFEFDTVCQRLELDSPQRDHEQDHRDLQGNFQETVIRGGVALCAAVSTTITPHTITAHGSPATKNAPEQGWVWRTATEEHENSQQAGKALVVFFLHNYQQCFKTKLCTHSSDESHCDLLPFAVLRKSSVNLKGEDVMKMAAPSLLNDYYSNLLDCSSNGMIALALGSSVYLWNSETQTLLGHLEQNPQPGPLYLQTQSVSSLSWSKDGSSLCIGTRQGELQLWDVEQSQKMRCLSSHLSVVRAVSWRQQLVSSGSIIGHIHHFDPRASTPLVGTAFQKDGICSLQWSPGDDMLASGSTEGLLCIWDNDVGVFTMSRRPITEMKQPSAVKAMGWCPWQGKMIATGGGWKDAELRIWDTNSETCVSSANTNSQICSLQWAEKKRYLVTGHGLPHHQVTCWTWDFPSLRPTRQLKGHSQRVLHLALNPESAQIFSAGADQTFNIWDI
ncbi:cell division cycle protein 20 homolog B-like [Cheilinus undulatus]|uniref:cell division cycle protein 20 homolog B-like n=1 Tax=Cheilinus undulatus TaxID=241271 RepID=UPI001BD474A7|nr:cell division cycle protein 20 homolog B-like [Cheilinus undulatus]